MAHITFIGRDSEVGSYQLKDEAIIGRSDESDIFLPDVFVSRQHCKFERHHNSWLLIDLDSANGVFLKGRQVKRRLLHTDDIIEVGSIAFVFKESDIEDPEDSTPVPFGTGPRYARLLDTIYAETVRPVEYVRQMKQTSKWKLATASTEAAEAVIDFGVNAQAAELQHEWTELDLEVQIDEAAELIRPTLIATYVPFLPEHAASLPATNGVGTRTSSDLVATPQERRWNAAIAARSLPQAQPIQPTSPPPQRQRREMKASVEKVPLQDRLYEISQTVLRSLGDRPLIYAGAAAAVLVAVVLWSVLTPAYSHPRFDPSHADDYAHLEQAAAAAN